MVALRDHGTPLTFWADAARTAQELAAVSPEDADAYPRFDAHVRVLARFLGELADVTPPRLDAGAVGDWQAGLKLARAYRRLSARAAREFTRALPMASADFVGEWFASDAVRGALAARGSLFTAMGPWSAGTACVLLADSAGNDGGAAGQTTYARGGPLALASALEAAATAAGAEVRTGAEVSRLLVRGARVTGVALASGEEIEAPWWRAASTRRPCSRAGSTPRRPARGSGGVPGTSARRARPPSSSCACRLDPSSPASTIQTAVRADRRRPGDRSRRAGLRLLEAR
jgi:phytoene dehydrogenase-like protein